jgi:superfamily II DNA helicase RecQ
MQHAKLFAYVNNNIDIKRNLQDIQFHLQLKSEQKEIIQNVLERKDSMAVLPTGFGKSMCYAHKIATGFQTSVVYTEAGRSILLSHQDDRR